MTTEFELAGEYYDIPFGGPVAAWTTGRVGNLTYDEAAEVFYYRDNIHSDFYALRRATMEPVEGYPLPLSDYHTGSRSLITAGLALTRRSEADGGGIYIESAVGPLILNSESPQRIVAMDPATGRNLGPETPLPYHLRGRNPDMRVGHAQAMQRHPTAPDSVMYLIAVYGFPGSNMRDFLHAIRPAYVPPYGVSFSAGTFPFTLVELEPGVPQTVTVTFERRDTLPGTYEAEIVVRAAEWVQTPAGPEAKAGEALAVVPVTLTVNPVSAEEGPGRAEALGLSVHPNPARGRASVSVSLSAASAVEVSVYDVLGRRVAVVREGPLGAGEHGLSVDVSGLSPGVYVVRAAGEGFSASRRVTVVR